MIAAEHLEMEIVPLAEQHGLTIYDVEVVLFGRPTIRIFADRREGGVQAAPEFGAPAEGVTPAPDEPSRSGASRVTIGDLERFAKIVIPHLSMKGLFPRGGHIEVSSPGLNRRLRRQSHFSAAVGSPVGVTAQTDTGRQTVRAKLTAVTDEGIALDSPELAFVPYTAIVRAQLDPEIRF